MEGVDSPQSAEHMLKNKVQEELENIRNILSTNGYPDDVVSTSISKKLRAFYSARKFVPEKCPVYIHLPWLGPLSQRFEKQIVTSVSNCYNSVKTNVIFMTRKILPGIQKDVLPALHSSNIIYLFRCDCDSRYVGRTSQRLVDRMKQHVPEDIRKSNTNQDNSNRFGFNKKCPSYTSSIGRVTRCLHQKISTPPFIAQIGYHLNRLLLK